MHHSAMPHVQIKMDGISSVYDGLVECLLILPTLDYCDPSIEKACVRCRQKALEYGFSQIGWAGYRHWMESRFPEEFQGPPTLDKVRNSYHKFMSFMKDKMPIFDRQTGEFKGYLDRTLNQVEGTPEQEEVTEPEIPSWLFTPEELRSEEETFSLAWVLKNCKFSSKR